MFDIKIFENLTLKDDKIYTFNNLRGGKVYEF